MNVGLVAARVAKKTYGDALKDAGEYLKMLEESIGRTRREILGLHGKKGEMSSEEWHQRLAQLVGQLKYLKRQYWEVETLLRRLVSEPDNESLWA